MKAWCRVGVVAASAAFAGCTRPVRLTPASSALLIRVVDSTSAARPVADVWFRLIGPLPHRNTVACSDAARQSLITLRSLAPGRYELRVARVGFETVARVVEVLPEHVDTLVVGLHPPTRDIADSIATGPPVPHCAARPNER